VFSISPAQLARRDSRALCGSVRSRISLLHMFDTAQSSVSAQWNPLGRTCRQSYHNSNAGSSNVNTVTRFHTGDRGRDLTTIATALRGRQGSPNLRLEATAWRQLAGALAAEPSTALYCALDMALTLCHAGTAGLSLLKTDTANGTTVRWEAVHGALAHYEGLDTPIGSSPCGLCLDADATILVSRPAKAFAWLADTQPSILEELIAPL
jgi:hypothetical protein